jgi:hypothetical protein
MAAIKMTRKNYNAASVVPGIKEALDAKIEAGEVVLVDAGTKGQNGDEYVELASTFLSTEQVETLKNGLELVELVNKTLDDQNINATLQLAFKTIDSTQDFGVEYANKETTKQVKARLAAARAKKA